MGGMNWFVLAQDADMLIVSALMYFQGPKNTGNFLTS